MFLLLLFSSLLSIIIFQIFSLFFVYREALKKDNKIAKEKNEANKKKRREEDDLVSDEYEYEDEKKEKRKRGSDGDDYGDDGDDDRRYDSKGDRLVLEELNGGNSSKYILYSSGKKIFNFSISISI